MKIDLMSKVKIGEGAFGSVFRARDRESGQQLALKLLRVRNVDLPMSAVRELNALRSLDHPHVVPLQAVRTHCATIALVMPFVPHSLASVFATRDSALPESDAGALARMLLQGVCAIHAEGLVHRDLKPANCLVDANGVLRIADFGQARLLPSDEAASLSHAIATRWYRAPELLFGARRYGLGVDVWACGCIVAQLLTISPLLPGDSDIDQLFRVVQLLGSPTPAAWPGVEALPDYGKIELPERVPYTPLRELMPLASQPAVDLAASMLRYDACARRKPRDALDADWIQCASRWPAVAANLFCRASR